MMKISKLQTHWTPEDAHTILSLLDELRDTLWQTYGEAIINDCRQQHLNTVDKQQLAFDFEDDHIPF